MNRLMVSNRSHPPGGRVSPRAAAGEAGTLNGTLNGTLQSRRPHGRARLRPGRGRDKARLSRYGCTCLKLQRFHRKQCATNAAGSRISQSWKSTIWGMRHLAAWAKALPGGSAPSKVSSLTASATRANAFLGVSPDGTLHGTLSGTLETAKKHVSISSREAATDSSRGWSEAEPPVPQKTDQAPKGRQIAPRLVERQSAKNAGGYHVRN